MLALPAEVGMSERKKRRMDDETPESLGDTQEVLEDKELEDVAGGMVQRPVKAAGDEEEEEPVQT